MRSLPNYMINYINLMNEESEITRSETGNKIDGMNTFTKYFLGVTALVIVVFFSWYFFSIIVYVLVAAVISFIGKPIIDLLGKIRIKGHQLPRGLKAGITLLCLWALFILFFTAIIPLAMREFQSLGNVSVTNIVSELEVPIEDAGNFLKHYGLIDENEDMQGYITDRLSSVVNVTKVKTLFGTVAGTLSDLFVALFSITFISFFFLKDSKLFSGMVLAIIPYRYEEQARSALDSIQKLLIRYFVGLLFEVFGVMALNTIGLSIVGLGFSNAIVIGLITGILNVIPYIGPLIGVIFGLSVGVVLNLDMEFYHQLLPLLIYMTIALLFTQLIDNIVFQPCIYGNSVHAHPLEIFLVILMAGSIAGIPGMILAIPSYTVLRVILKEFFNKYKLVKKLTQSLNE